MNFTFTQKQNLRNAKLFADYLIKDLAPDLQSLGMDYTASDVIEAATTIKTLLGYVKQQEEA